ncbi:trp operon leader peptide [Streptomyces canus]|uniref:trp operon leader peptide n=1 Tax=Streptomyces canus TaxID=58343 RepID=UPI0038693CBD
MAPAPCPANETRGADRHRPFWRSSCPDRAAPRPVPRRASGPPGTGRRQAVGPGAPPAGSRAPDGLMSTPRRSLRRSCEGKTCKIRAMHAHSTQNWWWTAHPAAH